MDLQHSLNKIADALKVQIEYEAGTVSGSTKATYQPLPGFKLPMTIKLSKLFANEAVGVTAHVVGDLHVLASHYPKTGAVSVFLIDENKLQHVPSTIVHKTMNLKQAVAALRAGIVASFLWKDRKWSTLNLPATNP